MCSMFSCSMSYRLREAVRPFILRKVQWQCHWVSQNGAFSNPPIICIMVVISSLAKKCCHFEMATMYYFLWVSWTYPLYFSYVDFLLWARILSRAQFRFRFSCNMRRDRMNKRRVVPLKLFFFFFSETNQSCFYSCASESRYGNNKYVALPPKHEDQAMKRPFELHNE